MAGGLRPRPDERRPRPGGRGHPRDGPHPAQRPAGRLAASREDPPRVEGDPDLGDQPVLHAHPGGGRTLAGAEPRLSDRREETVLCIPPGTGIRTAFEQSCARAGLEPEVDLSGSNPETLLGLTARGLGVCVLAGPMARGTELVATTIVDAEVRAGLALVIRDGDRQRATRRLYDLLRSALS
ncbi:LysR substrate-binding domain-containing protein [Nocardioides sp.]|uniref:LysR substrate-binding domain-containing protein n=1 Tax=Nocardioides sp. TaxID=35761 RepID=UPI0019B63ACF|nr:LysR substrate-binding domain-containing protein [Nocardioides sp.]MBC7279469.1 hypothetical protein [Nocardioides sp.]